MYVNMRVDVWCLRVGWRRRVSFLHWLALAPGRAAGPPPTAAPPPPPAGARLLLAGTIQFGSAVQVARARLAGRYPALEVPKCKPLSPGEARGARLRGAFAGPLRGARRRARGAAAFAAWHGAHPPHTPTHKQHRPQVLGCTAPALPPGEHDALVFVADGRFHLEAMMIANPSLPAFRRAWLTCLIG